MEISKPDSSLEVVDAWKPLDAPLKSDSSNRSPGNYLAILAQFGVETNPRYTSNKLGKSETYCNIFVWDVTKAMTVEIPHWIDTAGNPSLMGKGTETNANSAYDWMRTNGFRRGWFSLGQGYDSPEQMANEQAAKGLPTVAMWRNPHGIGHMAMVLPPDSKMPGVTLIAQAGTHCLFNVPLQQGFGVIRPQFFFHY